MSIEHSRVGPLVILADDYGEGDGKRRVYSIWHQSRTGDHGCYGCWHDADGKGYCIETNYYIQLMGDEFDFDDESLEDTLRMALAMNNKLNPTTEEIHF